MDTFIIVAISLGVGFFMCLLLLALCTLVVQCRAGKIKEFSSIQISGASNSLLVKRNRWPTVQHKRRQFLDLTTSDLQTSQSLGSLACPYTDTRRHSSQSDGNYNIMHGLGMGFSNQNNNSMGLRVKEGSPSLTSSTLSLCNYSEASSLLALTAPATSCTASPPTPKTRFFTLNKRNSSHDDAFRLRPLPQPPPIRVRGAYSSAKEPIPRMNYLNPNPLLFRSISSN